jgi:hypothetical protein
MPHGGYRPFDIAVCPPAFPDFRYTSLADGLKPGARRRAAKDMTPFPVGFNFDARILRRSGR